MKIIGETKDSFILTATRNEVANLIGHYWYGSDCPRLSPGAEIKVAAMYQHLTSLAANKNTIAQAARSLRGLADLMEVHSPVVEEITKIQEE